MPITIVELNILPATIGEAPSVDIFKARLCSVKLSTLFTRYTMAFSQPLAPKYIVLKLIIPYVEIRLKY